MCQMQMQGICPRSVCVCVHIFVSEFAALLCCGRCLWVPGSQMKAISHVAASVELLSQRAATNQCFLLLSWRDSSPYSTACHHVSFYLQSAARIYFQPFAVLYVIESIQSTASHSTSSGQLGEGRCGEEARRVTNGVVILLGSTVSMAE